MNGTLEAAGISFLSLVNHIYKGATMNKYICLARFAKDPELRYTTDNTAVLRGRVAVPRAFKKDGEPSADFINVVAFGKNAENIQKYFTQGIMLGAIKG
jgi:single-strand DNA-binding protein